MAESETPDEIRLPKLVDMHVHLRQGPLLKETVSAHLAHSQALLPMPNTQPPIANGPDWNNYRQQIFKALPSGGMVNLVGCIKLLSGTNSQTIDEADYHGVKAVKFYPRGLTTNAEDGLPAEYLHSGEFHRVMDALQAHAMTLCLHGEAPETAALDDCLDRERRFVWRSYRDLVMKFPKNRIVLEHISTVEAVRAVEMNDNPNHVATITAHHLLASRNHLLGTGPRLAAFCRPMLQSPVDQIALCHAAFGSGKDQFFLGSDSAPHPLEKKRVLDCCAAGAYTAPHLPELLLEAGLRHFALAKAEPWFLERLTAFACDRGAKFYGIARNPAPVLRFRKEPWKVLDVRHTRDEDITLVPFWGMEKLTYYRTEGE